MSDFDDAVRRVHVGGKTSYCVCGLPLPDLVGLAVEADAGEGEPFGTKHQCPCGREWVGCVDKEGHVMEFAVPVPMSAHYDTEDEDAIGVQCMTKVRMRHLEWCYPYSVFEDERVDRRVWDASAAKDAGHIDIEDVRDLSYSYMRWYEGADPNDVDEEEANFRESAAVLRWAEEHL